MCDIECVFESMTGRGSIFISNLAAAQNLPLLQAKGIGAVLSAARSGLLQHPRQAVPFYLYLALDDHEEEAIERFFGQAFEFIEQGRRQTNVLVHCVAGISRSATLVAAYLIKKFKYSLEELLPMMQRKRSKVNPNPGFIEQLRRYALTEGQRGNRQPQGEREGEGTPRPKSERQREAGKEYLLSNPLGSHEGKVEKTKTLERTASTKEDMSELSKQLKKEVMRCEPNLEGSLEMDKLESVKPQELAAFTLRKRFSFDPRPEKKLTQQQKDSIEQKIIKVREKVHLKAGTQTAAKQGREEGGRKEGTLQNLKLMLERKRQSRPSSEYLSLASTALDHQQIFIRFCETEVDRKKSGPSYSQLA